MRSTRELIARKRDGNVLETGEIHTFLEGAVDGSIPEYQVAAMLMAIFFRGMADDELSEFTAAMIDSGDQLSISTDLPLVDKHSTGGVGDKISIPLAPLMATCGVAVPMMSGRGLGHTGGTLDKLESIDGFRTDFTPSEFADIVERIGCVIAGQSDRIVPADRLLYRLRDTTATVASIPLIASSIMSKKLAEGLDALVLDIKVGLGAFMKTDDDARRLARTMIRIGSAHGVDVRVFLTAMDQPLGTEVGNANEIAESVAVLRGQGPDDVTELTLTLGAAMLEAAGVTQGHSRMREAIESGAALDKFLEMVEAQGGDGRTLLAEDESPRSADGVSIQASSSGYVVGVDAYDVGMAGVDIGAGRVRGDDQLDPTAGISLSAKIGDHVEAGQTLASIFRKGTWRHESSRLRAAEERLQRAFTIGEEPPQKKPLIREEIAT